MFITDYLKKLILLSVLSLTATLIFSQATLVKDINPGSDDSSTSTSDRCDCLNSQYIFLADDGVHGKELWISDGTENGTTMIKDINEGMTSTSIFELTVIDNIAYFLASTVDEGFEPWRSDGTSAGTFMLKDINSGSGNSSPGSFTPYNGKVYFTATASDTGREIWMTDGTTAGTELAFEVLSGNNSNGPIYLNVFQDNLYFWSKHNNGSDGFYRSDGTTANTTKIADVSLGNNQVNFPTITVFNGKMYFAGDTNAEGTELWISDGTEAGTMLLADTEVGNGSGYPRAFHEFQGALYFGASGDFWKTDGTTSGTVKIAEPNLTRILNESYNIVSNDDYMLFWGKVDLDKRLWRSDGTTAGTVLIDDQVGSFLGTDPRELMAKDGVIYFVGDMENSGVEVAYSMGEINDAQNISDVQSGTSDSDPFSLKLCGSKIFFYANDATNGNELFVADNLTSIEPIQNQQKPEVVLMPNPVEDYLIVDIKESYDLPFEYFKIISSNGAVINEGNVLDQRITINTSKLPLGIYFLELYGDSIRMTKHFVKN